MAQLVCQSETGLHHSLFHKEKHLWHFYFSAWSEARQARERLSSSGFSQNATPLPPTKSFHTFSGSLIITQVFRGKGILSYLNFSFFTPLLIRKYQSHNSEFIAFPQRLWPCWRPITLFIFPPPVPTSLRSYPSLVTMLSHYLPSCMFDRHM